MSVTFQKRILIALSKKGTSGLRTKELYREARIRQAEQKRFHEALDELVRSAQVVKRGERYQLTKKTGLVSARITRVQKTFGFAKRDSDGAEVFIPGKYLKGALPEDVVLISPLEESRGESPEGRVVSIASCGPGEFTGEVVYEDGRFKIKPDRFLGVPIELVQDRSIRPGEKVLAKVVKRGERHFDHKAAVIEVYGSAESASNCAKAYLALEGVSMEFPDEVMSEAAFLSQRGITEDDYQNRLDLRDEIIFTIDGADAKDLDDAVSLTVLDNGYRLGVHIADVSRYVRAGSALDTEALARGTSIYYANRVIPMLPKELSNGICSLNPNEDRLTFSAIMTLDENAALVDFDFRKSVIRSRVKGVYSEINTLYDGTADETVKEKYKEVWPVLQQMRSLAEKAMANRKDRGAPELETAESKIVVDENDTAVDVLPRTRGFSERLIEEFMLLANEAAATLAKREEIPFVYRVHEDPSPEKLEMLSEVLRLLGLNAKDVKVGIRPKQMAGIIDEARKFPHYQIINGLMLRAMAKARYSEIPIGHYGLALENYSHFTSPIRRYPDLMIHRILNALIVTKEPDAVKKRFHRLVKNVSVQSSNMELLSVRVERECEDCYKAEYMKNHVGETCEGIIGSVTQNGFYVELENTVEGLVKGDTLPDGPYSYDEYFELKNASGKRYRVGEAVTVVCTGVNVGAGQVDFKLAGALPKEEDQ